MVFRWRRQSCPDDEGHLCCLGHGDILVMDGRCQDKFLHRTYPLVGNRNGSTLCSVGSNNMLPPVPFSEQESHVVCQHVRNVHQFLFWGMLFLVLVSYWCLVHMESACFASLPVVYKVWVTSVCLLLDTPFGRRSVGGITFVTSEENA